MTIKFRSVIPINMVKFPMTFVVSANATEGSQTLWEAEAPGLAPIKSAIPTEFMGPGGGYSPEDLFAIALLNCLIATFKVYCEKSKVYFASISGKITLTVDKAPPSFAMTVADIALDIQGAADIEKTRKMMDAAIRDCAVSNSIKTAKNVTLNFS